MGGARLLDQTFTKRAAVVFFVARALALLRQRLAEAHDARVGFIHWPRAPFRWQPIRIDSEHRSVPAA